MMTPQRFSVRYCEQGNPHLFAMLVHKPLDIDTNGASALIKDRELRFMVEESGHLGEKKGPDRTRLESSKNKTERGYSIKTIETRSQQVSPVTDANISIVASNDIEDGKHIGSVREPEPHHRYHLKLMLEARKH